MKKVLVLCTGNSCRSQMAEGYLRHFAKGEVDIKSAGTHPSSVHPLAIQVMAEDGVSIEDHTSDQVDDYSTIEFDYIFTVCDNANESCPAFPGNGLRFHYSFTDPAHASGTEEEQLQVFRSVRDEIRNYCQRFARLYLSKEFIWQDKTIDFDS